MHTAATSTDRAEGNLVWARHRRPAGVQPRLTSSRRCDVGRALYSTLLQKLRAACGNAVRPPCLRARLRRSDRDGQTHLDSGGCAACWRACCWRGAARIARCWRAGMQPGVVGSCMRCTLAHGQARGRVCQGRCERYRPASASACVTATRTQGRAPLGCAHASGVHGRACMAPRRAVLPAPFGRTRTVPFPLPARLQVGSIEPALMLQARLGDHRLHLGSARVCAGRRPRAPRRSDTRHGPRQHPRTTPTACGRSSPAEPPVGAGACGRRAGSVACLYSLCAQRVRRVGVGSTLPYALGPTLTTCLQKYKSANFQIDRRNSRGMVPTNQNPRV